MRCDDEANIDFRWRRPIVGWIAEMIKWPLQILYFCGYPGKRLLFWLNDFFLTVGRAEYRWPGKDWEPVIGDKWTYANSPADQNNLRK